MLSLNSALQRDFNGSSIFSGNFLPVFILIVVVVADELNRWRERFVPVFKVAANHAVFFFWEGGLDFLSGSFFFIAFSNSKSTGVNVTRWPSLKWRTDPLRMMKDDRWTTVFEVTHFLIDISLKLWQDNTPIVESNCKRREIRIGHSKHSGSCSGTQCWQSATITHGWKNQWELSKESTRKNERWPETWWSQGGRSSGWLVSSYEFEEWKIPYYMLTRQTVKRSIVKVRQIKRAEEVDSYCLLPDRHYKRLKRLIEWNRKKNEPICNLLTTTGRVKCAVSALQKILLFFFLGV